MTPGSKTCQVSETWQVFMNGERAEFRDDAFRDLLRSHSHLPPGELIDRTLEALKEHAAGTPASDDVTMVVLRRLA